MKNLSFDEICNKIVQIDDVVRFAGIANKSGVLVSSSYRKGLTPLMTKEETSQYAIQAVTRAMLREDFTAKLGEFEYSIGKYQKLIRALIPFEYLNDKLFILISSDVGSNPIELIEDKVIPYLQNKKEP
jgi:hypothetical protein